MNKHLLPYYAVIFTSTRTPGDHGYSRMATEMEALVKESPGFLGMDTARSKVGITVSYWRSLDDIAQWRNLLEHREAQRLGREKWYSHYTIRVCTVEREYTFERNPG